MPRKRKKAPTGEGTYSKDAEGRFVWTLQHGAKRRVVKRRDYGAFRKEVDRVKAEVKALGVGTAKQEVTVEQFVSLWVDSFIKPPGRSRKTYENYLALVRLHIKPYIGRTRLNKLTMTRVQSWILELTDKGTGTRQIQQAFMVLSKACTAAMMEGRITRNPCLGCQPPKTQDKPMRVLSPEQVHGLLAEAYTRPPYGRSRPSRYRHLFRFALSTGMRIGELLGLQWINCDLRLGIVHIRTQLDWRGHDEWDLTNPKTRGSVRSIVLEPAAVKALLQQRSMQRRDRKIVEDQEDHGLVFTTLRGTPCIPRNVQRQLDALLERAKWVDPDGNKVTGIPHVGLHDLRRTALTNLANRGMPMHQLKAYAGHSSISTSARFYIHVSLEAQRVAIGALAPLQPLSSAPVVIHLKKRRAGS